MAELARFKNGPLGGMDYPLNVVGFVANLGALSWPPPETIELPGGTYCQTRRSQLTDDEAAKLTFIIRAAEYEWEPG